jgi:hypothetical protein
MGYIILLHSWVSQSFDLPKSKLIYMATRKSFALFLFFFIVIVSCSKQDYSRPTETNKSMSKDKWNSLPFLNDKWDLPFPKDSLKVICIYYEDSLPKNIFFPSDSDSIIGITK